LNFLFIVIEKVIAEQIKKKAGSLMT